MAALRFTQFSGEIPRLLPRLLPDTGAQQAENVRLDDGGLTPVRQPRVEHVFDTTDGIQTIYKFGVDWLYWTSIVNAVPGPVATDRLYYTGDGVPKMRVGTTVYDLAVPAPSTALTATISGANEVQQIVVSATGGTFTVTFNGKTTTALAFNVSAASLQTALEALDTIEVGDVTVTGGPGATNPLVITFGGRFAHQNVPEITTTTSLTGGTSTATVTTTTQGAGSGDVTTLVWVYTFVTDYGEESEPCPISNEVNWQAGQTITLSGFAAAPAGRAITKQRIYQLQDSIATGADLFLIEERNVSTSNFVYTTPFEDFAEVLPSRDWNPPPDAMQGLVALPNGMMAGFVGKDLYFCEPYRPHAWPEKYVLTMDFEIVALGAFGTSLVVATTGQPYVVQGTTPDTMQQQKLEMNAPCLNARGLVDLGYSVAFPSSDGLIVVGPGGASNGTEVLFTRSDWQQLTPSTIVASQFAGRYFGSYEYLDATNNVVNGTVIIDLTGSQPFVLRTPLHPTAFYYDIATGSMYFLIDKTVYEWDPAGQQNGIMTWKSKRVVLPAPATFGAILVEGNKDLSPDEEAAQEAEIAAIEAANAALFALDSMGAEINGAAINDYAINNDGLQPLPADKFVAADVYADGVLVATITEFNQVKRLPGVRARTWEVRVSGTAEVEQISIATTARELNAV